MSLVDEYGGDDDASMAANNTSAYNCRRVAGDQALVEPRLRRGYRHQPAPEPLRARRCGVSPGWPAVRDVDRSAGAKVPPGVIVADDVVVRAFAAVGWEWGGDWVSAKDYQHFSAAGG